MEKFQKWLAETPEGTFFKVAAGAAIGAVASWVSTANVSPLVVALCSALTPVIINYLNGQDPRYGVGKPSAE